MQPYILTSTTLTRASFPAKVVYPFEITMNAKAWNGRVVCAWLAETLPLAAQAFDRGHDGGRVTLTCHALTLVLYC